MNKLQENLFYNLFMIALLSLIPEAICHMGLEIREMGISLEGLEEVEEVEGALGSLCFRLGWMMEGRVVL